MGSMHLDQPFDYIVVGGGTAGLVVANRLSEDSRVRVLVVEAGADKTADPLVLTPGLVTAVYGKEEYDWQFPSLNHRRIPQARGKMLGGSSALNFFMMVYPSRGSLDAWAEMGNRGWDFEALAPYFRRSATVHAPPRPAKDLLGLRYVDEAKPAGDGPVQVSYCQGYNVTNKAWLDAFAELGLETRADPRDGTALGAMQNHVTIDPSSHTRSFAASAYYPPEVARRPNLVVLTETLATKVLFDAASRGGGEPVAAGVEVLSQDGRTRRRFSARAEVILAAGALQTPQLLEVSGVGGRELLERLGIPVVVDNPNVGEHLQDHPIVCQSFQVADGIPSADALRDPDAFQALLDLYAAGGRGEGPLGESTISTAYAPFVDARGVADPSLAPILAADPRSFATPRARAIRKLAADAREPMFQYILFPSQVHIPRDAASVRDYFVPALPENYVTVMTILNHPLSCGSVHATAADPRAAPAWDPRYNRNPLDLELLARGVQFVERLVRPDGAFGGAVLKPGGRRVPDLRADDLETAREIVRQRQISVFHLCGSCRMLPRDRGGVVDERLRVYGVRRLRIVDASVFPLEPSGNIQSVVYAVAERAADLIKEDQDPARR
ncbi:hypothetical protein VTJ83DRAFT_3061 [Remersonia thermophila]|uniref:Glucose-methanol-choline oxidoreductase N-terminal domain-containing protein n=1 Tax=Remersonia thermophila TaxID=72144 RepID=A0ABR4DDM8_9PEZI